MDVTPQFYSIPQLAELLKYSRQQIWNMCRDSRIKAVRIPGKVRDSYRIPRSEVERLLSSTGLLEHIRPDGGMDGDGRDGKDGREGPGWLGQAPPKND